MAMQSWCWDWRERPCRKRPARRPGHENSGKGLTDRKKGLRMSFLGVMISCPRDDFDPSSGPHAAVDLTPGGPGQNAVVAERRTGVASLANVSRNRFDTASQR